MIVAGAAWMAWQRVGGDVREWWRARNWDAPNETVSAERARQAIDTALEYAGATGNSLMEECLRSAGAATYLDSDEEDDHDHGSGDEVPRADSGGGVSV